MQSSVCAEVIYPLFKCSDNIIETEHYISDHKHSKRSKRHPLSLANKIILLLLNITMIVTARICHV